MYQEKGKSRRYSYLSSLQTPQIRETHETMICNTVRYFTRIIILRNETS